MKFCKFCSFSNYTEEVKASQCPELRHWKCLFIKVFMKHIHDITNVMMLSKVKDIYDKHCVYSLRCLPIVHKPRCKLQLHCRFQFPDNIYPGRERAKSVLLQLSSVVKILSKYYNALYFIFFWIWYTWLCHFNFTICINCSSVISGVFWI